MPFTKETAAQPRASKHQGPAQEVRQRLGLTQAQIAEKLGVSTVQWQRWERGTTPIPRTAELAIKYLEESMNKTEILAKAIAASTNEDLLDTALGALRVTGGVMQEDFSIVGPRPWQGYETLPEGESLTFEQEVEIVKRFIVERCK